MLNRRFLTAPAVIAAILFLLVGPCIPAAEHATRTQAIKQSAQALDDEVKAHGGSWDKWFAALEPYRNDLVAVTKTKWPWEAKRNFRFLGASLVLQLRAFPDKQEPALQPLQAIVHFDRQLKQRGIDLIVMPIPDKLAVYPDYLSDKAPDDRLVAIATKQFLAELLKRDVEVIDLHTLFRDARRKLGDDKPLYYDTDSHWRNRAAAMAGEQIAKRLLRYDFAAEARKIDEDKRRYATRADRRTDGAKADEVTIVIDRKTKKPYDDVGDSPVVVTGDSFSMYNMHLGAHMTAHIAHHLNQPVSYVCRPGLTSEAATELAKRDQQSGYLKGRKVVVWTFASRFLGKSKWPAVSLPGGESKSDDEDGVREVRVTGKIAAVSPGPKRDAAYPDYLIKVRLTDITPAEGATLKARQAVVRLLAMKDRKLLPAASLKAGQTVSLKLTSWSIAEATHGKTAEGALPTTDEEIKLPHFFGELADEKQAPKAESE